MSLLSSRLRQKIFRVGSTSAVLLLAMMIGEEEEDFFLGQGWDTDVKCCAETKLLLFITETC